MLITLVTPAIIPMANARHVAASLPPTYLTSLEGPREREPFAADRIPDLQTLQPGYVVIGDSMAGTRVDERLIELTVVQVAPLWSGIGLGILVPRAQELGDRERHQAAHGVDLFPRREPDRRDVPPRRAVPVGARPRIGWLLFGETELAAIVRDLRLSPFGVSDLDRQTGTYLFLLALGYSVPLWIQSFWAEASRGEAREQSVSATWPRLAVQGVACGLALAAILVLRSRTSLDFIYFQF